MNKLLMLIGLIFVSGIVFAVQAGVTFSPTQIATANLKNYDFELTNEGWTTTKDSFDFNFGYITGEKVFEDGEWTGKILTIQKYRTEKYWKDRYKNCRTGKTPYVYEVETEVLDDLNNPIMKSVTDSSKNGCIAQAKENIKKRVIDFRETKRKELLAIQTEVNNIIDYKTEWNNPVITDQELNE